MKISAAAALAFLFSFSAHALVSNGGATGGNGGEGVYCGSRAYPTSAELLDLYEARRLYHFSPELGPDEVEVQSEESEYLTSALKEAQARAESLLGNRPELTAIFKQAHLIANALSMNYILAEGLESTNDEGQLLTPLTSDCRLSQFAVFYTINPHFTTFFISEKAYNLMSDVDLASLLLHEASHIYFINIKDTTVIRQFVSYLTAPADFRDRNKILFEYLFKNRTPLNPALLH